MGVFDWFRLILGGFLERLLLLLLGLVVWGERFSVVLIVHRDASSPHFCFTVCGFLFGV